MKLMMFKSHGFHGFNCGMATTRVCVGGNVAARSCAQSKEPPPLHHRVISGKSCQDHHSPEVQAKVKLKSLVKSAARWPHSTGHAVGYEGLWAFATPLGSPEGSPEEAFQYLPLGRRQRWLTCPCERSSRVFKPISVGSLVIVLEIYSKKQL